MRTFYSLSIIAFVVFSLSACKKDAKPNVPASLVGEWYVRQYTITTTINNTVNAPYVYFQSDTAKFIYYQFNSDGTGLEQLNFNPVFASLPATRFNFRISGSNIIFSQSSNVLESPTCSFEMPDSNTLFIRSNNSYTDKFGNAVNVLDELDLSR
jgi:hypothetical protein